MRLTRRTAIVLTATAALSRRPSAMADESTINVGATVPMTGPLSLTGRQYLNTLHMAEEDINKAGGINGRPLRIIIEDTGASNSTAVDAFVRVVQEYNPPFVFLSSYSTENRATEPDVTKAQIPVMYSGGADVISDPANPWMFRIRPEDSMAARAMVQFLITTLKAKKPGIIYIQNDFGQGGAKEAEEALKAHGITPVGVAAYGQTDKDFSAQLLNIHGKGADVLLAFSYPVDAALLLQQRKMLGLKMPMIASSSYFVPAALQLVASSDLLNVWGVTDDFVSASAGGRMQAFVERYKARFHIDPDPYGLAYYDGAMMLADGLRKVGPNPQALRDWLAVIKDWHGIGHTYSFDAKGNGVHDVVIVRAKPGTKTLELVQTIHFS